MIPWARANSSHRSGLIVLALLAVLLPAVLFSIVQYRSLADLESKTRAAVQDNLRDVELNFGRHQAQRRGQALELSPREFGMLKYFVQHRGDTVTRDQLLDDVWGYDNFPLTRTVDNHIARLRQKIEDNPAEPRHLITVHRVGYKFLG